MASGQGRSEDRVEAALDAVCMRSDQLTPELKADLTNHQIFVARNAARGRGRVNGVYLPAYIREWAPVACERLRLTQGGLIELAMRMLHKTMSRVDAHDLKLAARGKL